MGAWDNDADGSNDAERFMTYISSVQNDPSWMNVGLPKTRQTRGKRKDEATMELARLEKLSSGGRWRDHDATEGSQSVYSSFGLGKVVAQNLQRPEKFAEEKEKLAKAMDTLSKFTAKPEKEADWAIAGGIAQGIGGVGAGVAAAAQTQINNQAVRERNASRAATSAQIRSLIGPVMREFGSFDPKKC